MKKTKRFLTLILALILATSGILSGIPGGGIARAEESSGKDISASLSQEMADWDVGAEIVGDETVAGEPWAEDSSSTAVVEEEKDASAVVEEDGEEGEEETLTDAVFGEYDPASAAEREFELEDSSDIAENQATSISLIEEDGEALGVYEEEAEDTQPEQKRGETLAGVPSTIIWFSNANIKASDKNDPADWKDNNADGYYIYAWGSSTGNGFADKVAMNWVTNDFQYDGTGSLYYFDIKDNTHFFILPDDNWHSYGGGDNDYYKNYRTWKIPDHHESIINGGLYMIDWIRAENECEGTGQHLIYKKRYVPAIPDPITVTKINTPGDTVIYYDASLSAISENKSTYTIPLMTYSEPDSETKLVSETPGDVYLVIDNQYYLGSPVNEGSSPSLSSLRGNKASIGQGSYLYKFLVDTSKITSTSRAEAVRGTFYFAAGKTENGDDKAYQGPSRTDDIKLADLYPATTTGLTVLEGTTATNNCFFGDSGDPWIYNGGNGKRGGYWGPVKSKRDPELRAFAQGTSDSPKTHYEHVYTSADATKIANNGSNTASGTASIGKGNAVVDIAKTSTSKPVEDDYTRSWTGGGYTTHIIYQDLTLYDYYSNWELNGNNRDNYPTDGSDNDFRDYYNFMGLNKAMSAVYYNNGTNSESNALYTGHFQTHRWSNALYSEIAAAGNWLYDYYSDTGIFESNNNSTIQYDGSENGDDDHKDIYSYVSKGLVAESIGNGLYTSNGEIKLPYFDEEFLAGNNVLNTIVGKKYEAYMPFQVDTRVTSHQDTSNPADTNTADGTLDYYVFASRYDLLSGDGHIPASSLPHSSSNKSMGDIGYLKQYNGTDPKYTDKYFVEPRLYSSIGDDNNIYKNTENVDTGGNGQDSMGFFPFNQTAENDNPGQYNYGYGAKIDFEFYMRYDGRVEDSAGRLVPTKFRFSGDDDVWIFVDNTLVLDLGGDHAVASGYIDFEAGMAYVETGVKKSPGNLDEAIAAGADTGTNIQGSILNWRENTASDAASIGKHTLTLYYMERGQWESNMMLEFNMKIVSATAPKVDLLLEKNWTQASDALSDVEYKVYAVDNDNKRVHIPNGSEETFRLTPNATDSDKNWKFRISGMQEFVLGNEDNGRYVYEVYEVNKLSGGEDKLIAKIGGGTSAGNPTITTPASPNSERIALKKSASENVGYLISGAGSIDPATAMLPKTYHYTATNTYEPVTSTIEKTWSPALLSEGESVVLKLQRKISGAYADLETWTVTRSSSGFDIVAAGTASATGASGYKMTAEPVDTTNNKCTFTVSGLPKSNGGATNYTYRFVEVYAGNAVAPNGASGSYTVTYGLGTETTDDGYPAPDTSISGTFKTYITNTFEKIYAVGIKKWKAPGGSDVAFADTSGYQGVTFTLQESHYDTTAADYTDYTGYTAYTDYNNFQLAWNNTPDYYGWRVATTQTLPKYVNGHIVKYRFVENTPTPAGYTTTATTNNNSAPVAKTSTGADVTSGNESQTAYYETTITNTPDTITITATKTYIGLDENTLTDFPAGTAPSIKLLLARKSNGGNYSKVANTDILVAPSSGTGAGTVTANWTNMPTHDTSGNLYTYAVYEVKGDVATPAITDILAIGSTNKLSDGYWYTVGGMNEKTSTADGGTTLSLSLTNTVTKPSIEILKYKAGAVGETAKASSALTGAVFTLTKSGGSGSTGSASGGVTTWSNLDNGTYTLVETTAPTGYEKFNGTVTFTVSEGGKVTFTPPSTGFEMVSGGTDGRNDGSGSTAVFRFSVPNKKTIKVVKEWHRYNDNDDTTYNSATDGYQQITSITDNTNLPANIYVKLYRWSTANGVAGTVTTNSVGVLEPNLENWTQITPAAATSPDANGVYTIPRSSYSAGFTISGLLAVDNSGNEYTYRFVEVDDSGNLMNGGSNISNSGFYPEISTNFVSLAASENVQTLVNKDEPLAVQVTKTFSGGTPTANVYVRLLRKVGNTEDPSFNSITGTPLNSPVESLTSTGYTKTWTNLSRRNEEGALYTYYVEETSSSSSTTKATSVTLNSKTYSVNYANAERTALNDKTGLTSSSALAIVNETLTATLTKAWSPALPNNGTSAIIRLERQVGSGSWEEAGTWTLTMATSNSPTVADVTTSGISPDPSTAYTVTTAESSSNWTFTVDGLPKTDASGNAYSYRFVEMKEESSNYVRVAHNNLAGEYQVSYGDGLSTGEFVTMTSSSTTLTQTITNTLAKFNLSVDKLFVNTNASDKDLPEGSKGTVYVKLQRKYGSNDFTDVQNRPVLTLDGQVDTSPSDSNNYESAAWRGTWKDLERGVTDNNQYFYYTYRVVEMTAATSGTAKDSGSYIKIPSNGNNVFKVTYGSEFVVDINTVTDASLNTNSLTVTNTLQPFVEVLKVDSSDNNTPLEGAIFTLTKGGTTVTSTRSSSDGKCTFAEGLEDGTYTLTETQAPSGYAMHSGSITFTLTNGTVSNISSNGSGMVGAEPTFITDSTTKKVTIQFKIANTAGTELPSTGQAFGLSRMGFASLGTVLLTAFVALYMYKKRQKYYDLEGSSDDNI